MQSLALDLDLAALTVTVRDARLFDVAEGVADSLGIDCFCRIDGFVVIYCANVDDLALLGELLADRAKNQRRQSAETPDDRD